MAKEYKVKPRWTKGQSGNPGGRPPKLITTLITDLKKKGYDRVTSGSIIEVYEVLLNLPEGELKDIINDYNQPLSIRIIGKQLMGNKGFEAIETVLSRAQGRPKQQLEVGASSEKPLEIKVKITRDDLTSDPIQ
jgi:hypothetical protein